MWSYRIQAHNGIAILYNGQVYSGFVGSPSVPPHENFRRSLAFLFDLGHSMLTEDGPGPIDSAYIRAITDAINHLIAGLSA